MGPVQSASYEEEGARRWEEGASYEGARTKRRRRVIKIPRFHFLPIALWGYPHVKWEIENLSQITTTAPIFLQFNYFRQKYLEIASCAVSVLNNIWILVEHSLKTDNLSKKSTLKQCYR